MRRGRELRDGRGRRARDSEAPGRGGQRGGAGACWPPGGGVRGGATLRGGVRWPPGGGAKAEPQPRGGISLPRRGGTGGGAKLGAEPAGRRVVEPGRDEARSRGVARRPPGGGARGGATVGRGQTVAGRWGQGRGHSQRTASRSRAQARGCGRCRRLWERRGRVRGCSSGCPDLARRLPLQGCTGSYRLPPPQTPCLSLAVPLRRFRVYPAVCIPTALGIDSPPRFCHPPLRLQPPQSFPVSPC